MKAIPSFNQITIALLVFGAALQVSAQVVRIQFSSEVVEASGPLLEGVSVGSIITGQITVSLAHLPPDSEPSPDRSIFNYSGAGQPGYVFQFSTPLRTYTLDSTSAATGLGIVPAISVFEDAGAFDLAARNEGDAYGVLLGFLDLDEPRGLLTGDYFPEDVNLAGGVDRATFTYSDFIHTNAVVANVIASSMVVESDTPAGLLIYRVRVSVLQHQKALLALLKAADRAFAAGHCQRGIKHLKHFQKMVREHVVEQDAVLADHLLDGAQEIIDAGCAAGGKAR